MKHSGDSHEYPVAIPLPTPFLVGPVNVYVYVSDPITLVDTGTRTEESFSALEGGLHALGIGVRDIRRVFVTHHHVDHIGLLHRILEISGAEAYGHPSAVVHSRLGQDRDEAQELFYLALMREFGVPERIQHESMQMWDEFRTYSEPFALTHTFRDGGHSGPFTTHFVPGHSSTDTLLVHESGTHTLVGDHILQTINPNPLLRRPEPGQARAKSLVEYQQSLRRTRGLALGTCLPGHGDAFERHAGVIDGILARHEQRNVRILDWIPPSGATPYEVAQWLYPDIETQYVYLALSVSTGHLELLETRGVLKSEMRGEIRYYSRLAQEPESPCI